MFKAKVVNTHEMITKLNERKRVRDTTLVSYFKNEEFNTVHVGIAMEMSSRFDDGGKENPDFYSGVIANNNGIVSIVGHGHSDTEANRNLYGIINRLQNSLRISIDHAMPCRPTETQQHMWSGIHGGHMNEIGKTLEKRISIKANVTEEQIAQMLELGITFTEEES